jgi:hypothetical protein
LEIYTNLINRVRTVLGLSNAINDKIGDTTDSYFHNKTLIGFQNTYYKHIHNPNKVYPDNCTTIDVVTSATANTFGNMVQAVPANTITVPFDSHWATVADISANGNYIVELWTVDGNLAPVGFLGEFFCGRIDNWTRASECKYQIPPIPANTRVGARAKKSGAGAGTVKFVLQYHDYEPYTLLT